MRYAAFPAVDGSGSDLPDCPRRVVVGLKGTGMEGYVYAVGSEIYDRNV